MCSWKVYTILCRTTFQSFACTEIDQDESFHQNDFTVDCNSGGYQAYSVVAAIFILIYPIGIVTIFVALPAGGSAPLVLPQHDPSTTLVVP